MNDLCAITYIGKQACYEAVMGKTIYELERNKSVGIGGRKDELPEPIAIKLSRRKENGKPVFKLQNALGEYVTVKARYG